MEWKKYSEIWKIANDEVYINRLRVRVEISYYDALFRITSMDVDKFLPDGQRIFGTFSFEGNPISHGIWNFGENPDSPFPKEFYGQIIMSDPLKSHLEKLKEVKPEAVNSIDDCIDFLSTPRSDNKYRWRHKK